MVMCTYVMLNLVVAVIIDNFLINKTARAGQSALSICGWTCPLCALRSVGPVRSVSAVPHPRPPLFPPCAGASWEQTVCAPEAKSDRPHARHGYLHARPDRPLKPSCLRRMRLPSAGELLPPTPLSAGPRRSRICG